MNEQARELLDEYLEAMLGEGTTGHSNQSRRQINKLTRLIWEDKNLTTREGRVPVDGECGVKCVHGSNFKTCTRLTQRMANKRDNLSVKASCSRKRRRM